MSQNVEERFKEQRDLVWQIMVEYPELREEDHALHLCLKFYELKYGVRFNLPEDLHAEQWESPVTIIRRRQEIQHTGQLLSLRSMVGQL